MKNTRLLALIILLLATVAMVWRFWDVVMLFFIAAIIAYLLGPIVKLLTFGGKVPRGLAVAVTALLVVGLFTWGMFLLVPYLAGQITGVVNDLTAYAGSFDQLLNRANELLSSWHLPQPVLDWATGLLSKSDTYLLKAAQALLNWLVNATSSVMDIVVVMILIIYFMLDGSKLIRTGLRLLPERVRLRATRVVDESNRYTWKYLGTKVLVSLGMAAASYIGFSIIGLRYALLFAGISFVLDFIPYFGSLAAGVIEAIFALITGGLSQAIKVAIFVVVIQQIEGNVVSPKVQSDAVDIHPLGVMFALLACSELWGPVGMLISTPVAVVFKTAIREVYYFILGEERPQPAPAQTPSGKHRKKKQKKGKPEDSAGQAPAPASATASPETHAAASPEAPSPASASSPEAALDETLREMTGASPEEK